MKRRFILLVYAMFVWNSAVFPFCCAFMLLFCLNAYLLERTQGTRETKAAFKSTHLTHATHLCGCHGEAFKKFCFFNYDAISIRILNGQERISAKIIQQRAM